jgi:hypothetical protein
MKKLFVISIFLVLIIGCNTKSRKQEEQRNLHLRDSLKLVYEKVSLQKINLEKEQQLIQDSIIKEKEKIAISDINFGISHFNYKLKEKNFLKSCQHEELELYYLGEFRFHMKGIFNSNDSLYCIILEGDRKSAIYNSDFGKQEIKRDYDALYSILKEKYSSPNVNYSLPDLDNENPFLWKNFTYDLYQRYGDDSHYCECTKWEIGKKKIEIILKIMPRKWNAISLIIYREDMATRVEDKNRKLDDLENQKIETKEKEDIEKAIKVL